MPATIYAYAFVIAAKRAACALLMQHAAPSLCSRYADAATRDAAKALRLHVAADADDYATSRSLLLMICCR